MVSAALSHQPQGLSFDGFDRYAGTTTSGATSQAVCFFTDRAEPDQVPANFFVNYDGRDGAFTVNRAYKLGRPKGAGVKVVADYQAAQLTAALPAILGLANTGEACYTALVEPHED